MHRDEERLAQLMSGAVSHRRETAKEDSELTELRQNGSYIIGHVEGRRRSRYGSSCVEKSYLECVIYMILV